MKTILKHFIREEDAMEALQIAVITAILLALAVAFRTTILDFCKVLAEKILGTT